MRSRRHQERVKGANSRFSPIAATQGKTVAKADRRCTCEGYKSAASRVAYRNPNCPVHGDGRPAGTGV